MKYEDRSSRLWAQLQTLRKERAATCERTLFELYVLDALEQGQDLDSLEVHLDRALAGDALFCPDRLSWCAKVDVDSLGIFAQVPLPSVILKLRYIPAGVFWMGSPKSEKGRFDDEGPMHQVRLTEGFWLDPYACTQALWSAVMGTDPSMFKGPERPVESITWYECQSFLKALNALVSGLNVSLPTEAQWEYACRAGTTGPHYGEPDDIAWYNLFHDEETHPVGKKQPNAFGLYDMLGNLYEMCVDRWSPSYGVPFGGLRVDPRGPGEGSERVTRGGAWFDEARDIRAASRSSIAADDRSSALGFRIARNRGAWLEHRRPVPHALG